MTLPPSKGFSIGSAEGTIIFHNGITLEMVKSHLRMDPRKMVVLFANRYNSELNGFKRVKINPDYLDRTSTLLVMVESDSGEFINNFLEFSKAYYPDREKMAEEMRKILEKKDDRNSRPR